MSGNLCCKESEKGSVHFLITAVQYHIPDGGEDSCEGELAMSWIPVQSYFFIFSWCLCLWYFLFSCLGDILQPLHFPKSFLLPLSLSPPLSSSFTFSTLSLSLPPNPRLLHRIAAFLQNQLKFLVPKCTYPYTSKN